MLASLLARELRGGAVHRRPFVAEFQCEGPCSGTVMNNPGLTGTPAFAAEYSKVYNNSKLLAIADEEGYVSIVDTSCELPTEMADDWGPNKPRAQWLAHRNAVFDISWCNGDTQMLTASGDQTIALWDTGHADLLASFRGHSGSVKTVCPLPDHHAVFASGARDGALMVWDARTPACNDPTNGSSYLSPVITIQDAHALSDRQKRRRTPLQGRTRPSVTSLTFLRGPGSQLATGGVDGIVKFWDLRQAAAGAAGAAAPGLELARLCDASVPHISQKQHGITSLALHPQGSQLLVSLTGGHHFIYDPLRPCIGPTRWFGGHTVASFYVKAGWSPDGSHIISGSTDRSVYIWEVDAPDGATPYVLPGHQGEVTAVAWCPSDFHQIATTADDATLKVWHIQRHQPEEQADDSAAARQPWVYPWQVQQQLREAAAAAAACAPASASANGGISATPGSATPAGPAGPRGHAFTASTAARAAAGAAAADATDGSATPWAAVGGGSSSASMLAALRSPLPSPAAALAATAGGTSPLPASLPRPQQRQQQQQAEQENAHANLHRSQQPGQAAAAAASAGQQQHPLQQQAPATVARPLPLATPFAAAGAASGSPATAAGRTVRRIGDLLDGAPSTRRTKQQDILRFLRSPAQAAAAGTAGKASSRDLPSGASSSRHGALAAAAPSTGTLTGAKRRPPLPGLGGSALPDQPAKRLRSSFETASAAASAFAVASGAPLEPSPEQGTAATAAAGAALAGKLAAAGAGARGGPAALHLQRQGSANENVPAGQQHPR